MQARRAAITCAPARVVDSVQPFSSCTPTPRPASSALMRRVSARSMAARATGVRPSATYRSTQAAALWASSSASAAACSATSPAAASA